MDNGSTNGGKIPLGGVISQNSDAGSMIETIEKPIIFYGGSAVISQVGHSKDLYDYYWTSYSRGTDGRYPNQPQWHNVYLDGYIPLRAKSIYDPCPYLYRIPSNGTWNQFSIQLGWTINSYLGGGSWNTTLGESWFLGLGRRYVGSGVFVDAGRAGFYWSSTPSGQTVGYMFAFYTDKVIHPNRNDYNRSYGQSVRCIDFDTLSMT